ncbi:MAG: cytochrome c oxidase subunit 3 [Candidatus Nanopelagicaceae bacterium]|nr:cytochrome c oxidase subunit 3 [Candidatus Nanopelagicaceae bacterium]
MSVETQTNPHHEHPDVVGSRNRLGLILILVADIAFALSVIFVYFYLKGQNVNDMWLPKATEEHAATIPVSSMGAWYLTIVAAFGLLMHGYALAGARARNQTQLVLGSGIALLASVVGLFYQSMLFSNTSFTITMGAYASCYFLIAGLNFVHLLITAFIALGNWNRSRLGLYQADHWQVEIVNIWWIWMTTSSFLGAFALSFT